MARHNNTNVNLALNQSQSCRRCLAVGVELCEPYHNPSSVHICIRSLNCLCARLCTHPLPLQWAICAQQTHVTAAVKQSIVSFN